ncbi:MAG: hypothetical protein RCG15_07330 [Candidatus Rickettsia vulgarisii]
MDNREGDYSGSQIGFYSYGSGCVAEYFSGILQSNYKQQLDADQNYMDMVCAMENQCHSRLRGNDIVSVKNGIIDYPYKYSNKSYCYTIIYKFDLI